MIQFNNRSWFFYYVICFLSIFNAAQLFRFPLIQQVSGLVALCIVPGFLLCTLFAIKVPDQYENVAYIVGISIIFDLLFGLMMNALLPAFGVHQPLSSLNLQVALSLIFLFLAFLIYRTGNVPVISWTLPAMNTMEKIFLTTGFGLLAMVIAGIALINAGGTNLFLISSILFIAIFLVFVILFSDRSIKRIYPFIIFLISFSLLMLITLRSNYIIGIDTHEEYFIFFTTMLHLTWVPNSASLLSSALSISILPTVFESFLNLDPQLLFKFLFPFLFSITPVIIFIIVRKYADELFAFIAACFFMFQLTFVNTSANSRTSLAIFFFALAVLVLCDKELPNPKKYVLFLLFVVGTVFSHYTTSLIFLLIMALVYLLDLLFSRIQKRTQNRFVNLTSLLFFVSLIFFWFSQVISNVFVSGIQYSIFRLDIFRDLYKNDVSKYTPPLPINPPVLLKFANYTRWLLYVVIGIGVLFAVYTWVQRELKKDASPHQAMNLDRIMVFLGVVSFGLLFCTVFAPSLFFGYDTGRTQEFILVILSVFLIFGARDFYLFSLSEIRARLAATPIFNKVGRLANYCTVHQNKIICGLLLVLVIPQLLFATFIFNQYDGGPYSIIYNSPRYAKNVFSPDLTPDQFSYSFDEDAAVLHWFHNYADQDASIFSDGYGYKKITSLADQGSILDQNPVVDQEEAEVLPGYVYLTLTTNYYGIFLGFDGRETPLPSFEHVLTQKNKIFSNGALLYK
jgi:uncharacterized membrane protein